MEEEIRQRILITPDKRRDHKLGNWENKVRFPVPAFS